MITPLVRLISCSAFRRTGLRCSAVRIAWSSVKVGSLATDLVSVPDLVPPLPPKLQEQRMPSDPPNAVTMVIQPVHVTARCCIGVPHLLRNRRHRKHFLPIEVSEKKKLRKGNVARREFLAQMQHETALHFQDDVGKPFGIRTNLVARTSCKCGNGFRTQGDKARNARETCQTGWFARSDGLGSRRFKS